VKRYSWILVGFIVVAILFIQHSSTPSLAFPTTAKTVGSEVRVPVTMRVPQSADEFWGLSKRADKQFLVSVWTNKKIVQQFGAQQVLQQSATETKYATSGDIHLDGDTYHAVAIDVNSDGQSGYIALSKEPLTKATNDSESTTNKTP
jgi:hypothetical protein